MRIINNININLIIRVNKISIFESSYKGVKYFLGVGNSDILNGIRDPNVWVKATIQIFNSIGIGFGTLINFSSFNNNSKTLMRDTILIASINRFDFF